MESCLEITIRYDKHKRMSINSAKDIIYLSQTPAKCFEALGFSLSSLYVNPTLC
jgi:hypothetical protein